MSMFQTSYNAYITPAENIPHEETQLVSRADFRVEDAHCQKWVVIYMYTRVIKLER
jgi:hypothetical protein